MAMKWMFSIGIGCCVLAWTAHGAFAEARVCEDSELQVKFFCDTSWQMQMTDQAVLILMDSQPDVTAILAKIDSQIKFLGQLTEDVLTEKNRYAPDFRTYQTRINGQNILLVKGFAMDNPDKRLQDYYLINNNVLYGVLFSVSPKDKAFDYVPVFRKIVESLEFYQ
jgi:hypothetical protein